MFPPSRTSPAEKTTERRGRIAAAVLAVCLAVIVGRLFQLQIVQHAFWSAAAAAIQERTIELPPRRGSIIDRDGELLAFDVKAMAIAVDGINATEPDALAQILSEELSLAPKAARSLVQRASYFTWVDRRVDIETARRIERRAAEVGAYGLILIDTWKRCYSQGSLASNVIGFVGTDGAGLEGIELAFDEHLRGEPRRLHVLEGADGRAYEVEVLEEGRPGDDLCLTLDAELQFICEEEIEAGVSRFRADEGMIVVLNPRTGDVLAMAQDKTYDLNRFWTSTADARRNLAVTYLFEPGSIFKVFTGVAALDAGVVSVGDTFNGNDGIEIFGHVMHNSEYASYGTVTFAQIIEDSINTGMIRVAQLLGEEALHAMLENVGFGRPTGIELPGEVAGILRDVEDWSGLALASTSIGQSVAVTGIQLARALAALADGGTLVAPHIVDLADGRDRDIGVRTVASSAACATMLSLMIRVVESGTGTLAAVDGFQIAGKTGTAQKAVPGRGYVDGKYTSLFAGVLTANDPEYVVLVVLDEVKTTPVWGGYTAGQIFRDTASRLIHQEQLIPTAAY
jgi:stage V sporulation protein D (sporulation-specific penicillin-binding protein)